LVLANKIEAKLIAHNAYGPSSDSDVGGTAVIVLVPSEPLSLANNPAITMGPLIGITWTPSAQVGGSVILDYQVWYDKARGDSVFEILESGVGDAFYTAEDLILGETYVFYVKARNSVGFSPASATTTILAAREPDIPDLPGVSAPYTQISGDNIIVTWFKPYNGGTPIESYIIQFRKSDNSTYILNSNCNGNDAIYLTT
jgi:hypothetical protein